MVSDDRPHPIGEVDYPRTLQEFDEWFASDAGCAEYLERLRWRDGFACPGPCVWRGQGLGDRKRPDPVCPVSEADVPDGGDDLRRHTQAAADVVSSHLARHQPEVWRQRSGLQRALGLGSYQTAWSWLQKLRRAMVRPARDRLSGRVEVDESYVGGEEEGIRGRDASRKAIVVIAVEMRSPKGFGRIRMRRILDASAASLSSFVRDAVEPGSTVHTDGWQDTTASRSTATCMK